MKSSILIPLLLICLVFVFCTDVDRPCNLNETKGLYIPSLLYPHIKCCKETRLVIPFPLEYSEVFEQFGKVNATDPLTLAGPPPSWAICRSNVTRDNLQDDLPTLMWKTEACVIQQYLGKSEDLIDYQTFVQFRTDHYADYNNVKTLVKQANKECPGKTTMLEFYKRIELYTWCFFRNEEKVCNEPTQKAKSNQRTHTLQLERIQSCSLNLTTKGLLLYHCCRGEPTPREWTNWHPFPQIPYIKAEDGKYKYTTEKVYTECITSAHKQADPENKNLLSRDECINACIFNPVAFQNETDGPQIKWNFQKAFHSHFSTFNQNILKDLNDILDETKSGFKVGVREYWNGNKRTIYSFDEMEKAYSESKNPVPKAVLYCLYYDKLYWFTHLVLKKYCHPVEDHILVTD